MNYIDNVYPTDIKLRHTIGNGVAPNPFDNHCMLQCEDSITLHIRIDSSRYPKEMVAEAVKEICQKAVEYFC